MAHNTSRTFDAINSSSLLPHPIPPAPPSARHPLAVSSYCRRPFIPVSKPRDALPRVLQLILPTSSWVMDAASFSEAASSFPTATCPMLLGCL